MNMVEKVARAIGIADLNATAKSLPNVPMETMAKYVKQAEKEGHYDAMARAAIEAMGPMMDDPDTLSAVLHDFDDLRPTFRRETNSAFREFWYTAVRKALSEESTS